MVSNLGTKDLSGSTDDWSQYVEFTGGYSGYLSYAFPTGMTRTSLTAITAQVNYRGPAKASQAWTFSLFDWSTNAWTPVGTNAAAPDWGAWTLLTFNATGTLRNYISPKGEIRLRLAASNGKDSADIDYAGIVLTGASGTQTDTAAPAAPGSLALTARSSSSVSLKWAPSTDNIGVSVYEIFSGSAQNPVATVTTTSVTVSGLSASTAYSFTVRARDVAGNLSAPTAALSVTTIPGTSNGLPLVVPCPGCWHPPLRTSWNWVISKVPHAPYRAVDVYDIDGFEATAADVSALHSVGKKAVCYLAAGSYENWRPDASLFPPSIVGRDLDGWPGERWLDVRDLREPNSALGRIIAARLDMCRTKGFDAVEFDTTDGYTNPTGFPLTALDQAFYNASLANGAHARGMSAVMKNDVEQISLLLPYFDMAINESCNEFHECGGYSQFIAAGKPVFNAEYGRSPGFCVADNAANINGVQFARGLDDSLFLPCR